MKILYQILIILSLLIIFSYSENIEIKDESVKKERQRQVEIETQNKINEANNWFKKGFNKEPTTENLLKIIENENPKDDELLEIREALSLINLRKISSERILKRTEFFFHNSKNDWIRFYSAQFIINNKSRDNGIKYLLILLDEIESRNNGLLELVITELLKNGNCEGFRKFEELVISNYPYSYLLIRDFIPFNGKRYNNKGNVINLKEFIESIKEKVSKEVYDNMKLILKENKIE